MDATSVSLLDRLRRGRPDEADWRKLRDIYQPLIRSWVARVPELAGDADDVTQEVFLVLLRELPTFARQRDGSFRAWLRQITVHRTWACLKDRRKQPRAGRGDQLLEQLSDPHSELAHEWDSAHDRQVVQKLLATVQPDVAAKTWQAFRAFALDGRPAADVAQEFGLSVTAVMQAKSRILKRLREEAGAMLD